MNHSLRTTVKNGMVIYKPYHRLRTLKNHGMGKAKNGKIMKKCAVIGHPLKPINEKTMQGAKKINGMNARLHQSQFNSTSTSNSGH